MFALELLRPGAGTKRTAAGRELWSRIGGFRRVLATPSSEDRFDFSGRKELYTAYIPWAVAFGVADQWAEKYRIETGEEPPTPVYFGSGYGYTGGSFASSMAARLLLDGQLGHLGVPGHPVLVVERRGRRRLLRRRRGRRRRGWLVVSPCPTIKRRASGSQPRRSA